MQTVYLKEHEGIAHNFVGQLSSGNGNSATVPWWSGFGSQSVYGETGGGQIKSFSLEPSFAVVDQLAGNKQSGRGGNEHVMGKGHGNQFTIFPGM